MIAHAVGGVSARDLKVFFFSGGGTTVSNMKKVDAFVAVELTQGPHLEEESVKDGLYGFRNIVCWKNGDLQLSGNPRVKRFWSGYVKDDEVLGDNHEADQVKMEPLERAKLHCLNPALHWPCLNPESCPFAWCKGNQNSSARKSSSMKRSNKKSPRTRAAKRAKWTDPDILENF